MKIAIVGSRGVTVEDIGRYVEDAEEIVSGGAVGVDSCAADYAREGDLGLPSFCPSTRNSGAEHLLRETKG